MILDLLATAIVVFGLATGSKPESVGAGILAAVFYGILLAAVWL